MPQNPAPIDLTYSGCILPSSDCERRKEREERCLLPRVPLSDALRLARLRPTPDPRTALLSSPLPRPDRTLLIRGSLSLRHCLRLSQCECVSPHAGEFTSLLPHTESIDDAHGVVLLIELLSRKSTLARRVRAARWFCDVKKENKPPLHARFLTERGSNRVAILTQSDIQPASTPFSESGSTHHA